MPENGGLAGLQSRFESFRVLFHRTLVVGKDDSFG